MAPNDAGKRRFQAIALLALDQELATTLDRLQIISSTPLHLITNNSHQ